MKTPCQNNIVTRTAVFDCIHKKAKHMSWRNNVTTTHFPENPIYARRLVIGSEHW